jgi:hypothetical protein
MSSDKAITDLFISYLHSSSIQYPHYWYPLHGPGRHGASEKTLARRVGYGGRKGKRALRRLLGK